VGNVGEAAHAAGASNENARKGRTSDPVKPQVCCLPRCGRCGWTGVDQARSRSRASSRVAARGAVRGCRAQDTPFEQPVRAQRGDHDQSARAWLTVVDGQSDAHGRCHGRSPRKACGRRIVAPAAAVTRRHTSCRARGTRIHNPWMRSVAPHLLGCLPCGRLADRCRGCLGWHVRVLFVHRALTDSLPRATASIRFRRFEPSMRPV
jgi:hypothetical protein